MTVVIALAVRMIAAANVAAARAATTAATA
jgi:hypothetical protein